MREQEFFYKEKFLKYKLTFPYFISLIKNPEYNFKLIFYTLLKVFNFDQNKIYEFIIKENCKKNDIYFGSKKNKELIKKLMLKINAKSKERRQKVIFLIFPQKDDLSLKIKNYYKFFSNLKNKLNIIDFTEIFDKNEISKIYLPSQYGGHLTSYGNKIVAETILKKRFF